ncbi:hypothetical protein [Kineosporia sp. NBRC 101731]|uniref:hypothetical protein n=1 Tax=Kineosporia sp. NBRC 101731 TaxID=3032199 RepID=UPI0024A21F79|nr:hypothetical protein [Kineosporia sp. NBRC 101731]GLY30811.1 hypothetical protein Kisp02_41760 [Kineosporia sp. NBRC 101731]
MAAFDKRDRVIATADLSGVLFAAVRRGDPGTVILVDESPGKAHSFTVKFDNGEIVQVREEDLYAEK